MYEDVLRKTQYSVCKHKCRTLQKKKIKTLR